MRPRRARQQERQREIRAAEQRRQCEIEAEQARQRREAEERQRQEQARAAEEQRLRQELEEDLAVGRWWAQLSAGTAPARGRTREPGVPVTNVSSAANS
ncbi:hypothetical protein [Micromonospora inyonensis]|uniref:hypothetical protein n=1 Tax=Micromonospora inyonensis TaxID=47866 RepID=UPI000A9AB34F|nr:hypothetical protein [Micromonospora inyonensis]